ncbi:helix-turn-helix domain-containing protein [Phascolarctobacterium succinatutens]|uniref:helix-turn-helix domain-containing protein n=1 Tax=Phascolarctobacterium succinatutens TaxID=626940 RepID=UPI0026E9E9FA|nr:helix-turn-helix domain-containing protein [Phascolarctobacterium succinatutens]
MADVLYMSIKDYAKHVSASVGTIYDMCRKGKLPAVKIGGWRINVKRADEMLEQLCDEHLAGYTPMIKPAKVNIRTANAGNSYLARLEQIRKGVV